MPFSSGPGAPPFRSRVLRMADKLNCFLELPLLPNDLHLQLAQSGVELA